MGKMKSEEGRTTKKKKNRADLVSLEKKGSPMKCKEAYQKKKK